MNKYQEALDDLSSDNQDISVHVRLETLRELVEMYEKLKFLFDIYVVNEVNINLSEGAQKLANALKIINEELKINIDFDLSEKEEVWKEEN
jgi:hypothetical protein